MSRFPLHQIRSCGLKQVVDYGEDIRTVYLSRAGLLEHDGENMTICLHHEQVLDNVFERHAIKCCGILKIHRGKTQGSKSITIDMVQEFKAKTLNIQPGHMLCRQCITTYEKIISTSSSDTEVEETLTDDIDEDALDDAAYKVYKTSRKLLNTRLETVDVSSVNLHGVS